MLSNKATPYYYGKFRDSVLRGEIPVCEEISFQMERIDDLIRDPKYYYDSEAIDGYIKFCENELTLTDGTDLKLLDTFKLWAEDLLSWFYFVDQSVYISNENNHGGHYEKRRIKKRLKKKQYLIVARGAAKTLYLESLQSYFQNVDPRTTSGIAVAPTMAQAEETLNPLRTAIIRSRGPLFKFLTHGSINNTMGNKANRAKLASTKKGIENLVTNSVIQVVPMSIDRLQGLRPSVATVDEWLSGNTREDVIGAIEQGASKNKDYIIVAASSEGNVRNGVGDSIKMELMEILKGEYNAPHVSIFYYKLDDVKEVSDPDMWLKANPNLGKTVDYETYQLDVERAEKSPSARNDILAKRFGIPLEGFAYFFTYEETIKHRSRSFFNMPCSLGIDLSQGDDFCAFTFLFPLKRGSFGIKTRCYISERTLNKLHPAMRDKYESFINEGSLMVLGGSTLKMEEVYDDLDSFITDCSYDIRSVGYDVYNSDYFITRWTRENSNYGVIKVPQGSRTESVPLGELKDLAEDRMLLFDEDLMSFCMGNSVVQTDSNGNRKLLKLRYDDKIDSVSAMMDAYVAYKQCIDEFE